MDAFYASFNPATRNRLYQDFLYASYAFKELNPTLEDANIEAYVERLIKYGRLISQMFEMSQHFFDLILTRIPQDMAQYFGYNGDPVAFRTYLIELMRNPETMIAMEEEDVYDIMDLLRIIDEAMADFMRKYNRDLEKTIGSAPRGGRKCKKCKGYIAT
jgi:hypothetical protein